MHILVTVFFNAPLGGLHNNIYSTVKAILENGHKVTVLCKSGPFVEKLKQLGTHVIITSFSNIEKDVASVINQRTSNYDIIHAHPFASRKVALLLAEKLKIPFFVTFHGMYYDEIDKYIDKVCTIFTVSEAIKNHLNKKVKGYENKFVVIPNGVNSDIFKPVKIRKTNDKINFSLISRLDKDKEFIIKLFYLALIYTSQLYKDNIKWTIVGDGSLANEMKVKVKQITKNNGLQVDFIGWKKNSELVKYYLNSDAVIAPGRCALEAMACGKPVLAIGSKGYIGLINYNNWLKGIYTNFGGYGNKFDDYENGSITKDLKIIIENNILRKQLGDLGVFITNQFFDERTLNKKIINFYEIFYKANTLGYLKHNY